jgi:hypothetical protein
MTILYKGLKLKVLYHVAELRYEALEIAAWKASNHIDLE